MRKNLLKQLTLALLMTVAVPTLTAQVQVGDILCEGNAIISPVNYPSSGATAIGVVFYVDQTGQHGWAVALEDAGSYEWGCNGSDMLIPNFGDKRQAIYDLDGYENTRIVRENCTGNTAFYAVDFESGWYVPAIGQLNYLYGNLVEVNASLQLTGGTAFGTGPTYWSSTENSEVLAWTLSSSGELDYFHYNYYGGYRGKATSRSVRGVRAF